MVSTFRHIQSGGQAALARPSLMILYGLLDLLSMVILTVTAILLLFVLGEALKIGIPLTIMTLEPQFVFSVLQARFTDISVAVPIAGVFLSGIVMIGVLRIFILCGAMGVLSQHIRNLSGKQAFLQNAIARFPAGIGAVLLVFLAGFLGFAWSVGLVWSSTLLYSGGFEDELNVVGLIGAAGLSIAITLLLFFMIFFDLLARITLVRVLVVGDAPAMGIWNSVSLMGRRPGSVIGLFFAFAIAQVFVSMLISSAAIPIAALSAEAIVSPWGIAARVSITVIRVFALAMVAIAAYGAFTSLVLDDEGLLPDHQPDPEPRIKLESGNGHGREWKEFERGSSDRPGEYLVARPYPASS